MRYWILLIPLLALGFPHERSAGGDPPVKVVNLDKLNTEADEEDPCPTPLADPPQDDLNPGNELLDAEGLRQVVVAADGQSPQPLLGGIASGEKDHGDVDPIRAHPPADLEAVQVREHHIQDDQIRGCRSMPHDLERVAAAGCLLDLEATKTQRGDHDEADVVFVLDDQHLGRTVHTEDCVSRTWGFPQGLLSVVWWRETRGWPQADPQETTANAEGCLRRA